MFGNRWKEKQNVFAEAAAEFDDDETGCASEHGSESESESEHFADSDAGPDSRDVTKVKKRHGLFGVGKRLQKDVEETDETLAKGQLSNTSVNKGMHILQKKKGKHKEQEQQLEPKPMPLRKRRSISETVEKVQEEEEKPAAVSFDSFDDDSNSFTSEEGFFSKAERINIEKELVSEEGTGFIVNDDGDIVEEKGAMEFYDKTQNKANRNDKKSVSMDSEEDELMHGREQTSDLEMAAQFILQGSESEPGLGLASVLPSEGVQETKSGSGLASVLPAGRVNTVFDRLKEAVDRYKDSMTNSKTDEEVSVVFDDDNHQELVFDTEEPNKFFLPNAWVYAQDKQQMWNTVCEVRIPRGKIVEIDFGLSIQLPEGCGLELQMVPGCSEKYGLRWVNGKPYYSAKEAAEGITVEVQGCTDTSYVAEYKHLFTGRVVRFGAA